jgi:uncharacterized protein (TIGR03067 family)
MVALARIVAISMLVIVVCGCRPGGDASGGHDAVADAQLWQGDWRLVSATHAGQTDALDGGWQVHGDRYDVTLNGKTDEHWQFTLNPGGRFDSLATWGPTGSHQDYLTASGSTDANCVCAVKGLYEVSPDRLRVVFDPAGREYPASFDVDPNSRFTTFVFQHADK